MLLLDLKLDVEKDFTFEIILPQARARAEERGGEAAAAAEEVRTAFAEEEGWGPSEGVVEAEGAAMLVVRLVRLDEGTGLVGRGAGAGAGLHGGPEEEGRRPKEEEEEAEE